MDPPIVITDCALKEIKSILKNKNIPQDYGLRIATKGMGCAVGFRLGFDKKKETDREYFIDGVRVLVQRREMMFVVGKKIQFYDEADGRGFMFVNLPTPR